MRTLVASLVLAVSLTGCRETPTMSKSPIEPVFEKLCDVLGAPDRYLSKPLTVRGAIVGFHEVFFYSPSCCGAEKLALVEDLDFDKRKEIFANVEERYPNSGRAEIQGEVVFYGILERNDGPQSPNLMTHLSYKFRVLKVVEYQANRSLEMPCPPDTLFKSTVASLPH